MKSLGSLVSRAPALRDVLPLCLEASPNMSPSKLEAGYVLAGSRPVDHNAHFTETCYVRTYVHMNISKNATVNDDGGGDDDNDGADDCDADDDGDDDDDDDGGC